MASWQSRLLKPVLRNWQRKRDLTRPIEEERTEFDAAATRFPKSRGVQYESLEIEGVLAERITAAGASGQDVILYLHGGCYILGSFKTERVIATTLSRLTGACVLSPNYRLAPEHPFPAAIGDALSIYTWVLQQGVDPAHVVVSGASAGGGLTIALMLAARDAGLSLPAAGVCLSPWLDLAGKGLSLQSKVRADVVLRPDMLEFAAKAYLASADPTTPLASPLYADLRGLPPLLLQVGTDELLLDDATRFASRARAAGVEVTLATWEQMFHGWQAFAVLLPEGRQAMEQVQAFIRTHLLSKRSSSS